MGGIIGWSYRNYSGAMVVCSCGYDNPPHARICGGCGQATTDGVLQLLDLEDPRVERIERGGGRPAISRLWVLATGIVLVALIGWAVQSLSTSPQTDDKPATSERDEDAPESRSTSTTVPGVPTTGRSEIEIVGDGSPLLGEEVGYDLLIGLSTGRPSVLDLDSGQLTHAAGRRVTPMSISGDWLVVRSPDRIAALPLDDLTAPPTEFLSLPDFVNVADRQTRSDGLVWLWVESDPAGRAELALFDIANDQIAERLPTPDGTIRGDASVNTTGPALVSALSGGVYESTETGFMRVTDGRLLAADRSRALVETCDARLRCDLQWLDRRTWQPIDLPVPSGRLNRAGFINGTDWLWHFSFAARSLEHRLLNVATGQAVGFADARLDYDTPPAISPDGRWLATVNRVGSVIQIVELATGSTFLIEGVSRAIGPLLFIDQESE